MSGPFKMKGSSGLGYGNQHSEGKSPAPMMGAIGAIAGKLMKSPAPYASPAKAGEATKSEKAKADGASEATIQKLKDQENKAKDFAKGKKKRDEETDSTRKQNLTTYIKENE